MNTSPLLICLHGVNREIPYLYLYCRPNYAHHHFETYYDNIPQGRRTETGTNPTATRSEHIQSRHNCYRPGKGNQLE